MLRAILLDDEEENIKGLRLKLERFCPDVSIIATYTDPLEALKWLPETDFELLFLDVEMPELNGFSLLKALPDRKFHVIMVTAYSEYAIKAFKANAQDYLLKPVDTDDLIEAVGKIKHQTKFEEAHKLPNQSRQSQDKITLHSAREIHVVHLSKIIRIEGENNYTTFHLADGSKIMVSRTLKDFEDLLHAKSFYRIHKSHIINLDYLTKVCKNDDTVTLANGAVVGISSRKKAEFLKMLEG